MARSLRGLRIEGGSVESGDGRREVCRGRWRSRSVGNGRNPGRGRGWTARGSTRSETIGGKPRSRPGRTPRGLLSMGTDGESPPSELEIDGDMLAETGSMLPPLEI